MPNFVACMCKCVTHLFEYDFIFRIYCSALSPSTMCSITYVFNPTKRNQRRNEGKKTCVDSRQKLAIFFRSKIIRLFVWFQFGWFIRCDLLCFGFLCDDRFRIVLDMFQSICLIESNRAINKSCFYDHNGQFCGSCIDSSTPFIHREVRLYCWKIISIASTLYTCQAKLINWLAKIRYFFLFRNRANEMIWK